MAEYLLSLWSREGGPSLSARDAALLADIGAFNAELQEAGAWVFAGGLTPPTATVVRLAAVRSPPPTARSRRPRSSSAASGSSRRPTSTPPWAWAAKATSACRAPIEVRAFQSEPPAAS